MFLRNLSFFLLLFVSLVLFFPPPTFAFTDEDLPLPTFRYSRTVTLHRIISTTPPTQPIAYEAVASHSDSLTVANFLSKLEEAARNVNSGLLNETVAVHLRQNLTALLTDQSLLDEYVGSFHPKIRTSALGNVFASTSGVEFVVSVDSRKLMTETADPPLLRKGYTQRDLEDQEDHWSATVADGGSGSFKLSEDCSDLRFTPPDITFYPMDEDPYTAAGCGHSEAEQASCEQHLLWVSKGKISGSTEWQNVSVPLLEQSYEGGSGTSSHFHFWVEGGCGTPTFRAWVFVENLRKLNLMVIPFSETTADDRLGVIGNSEAVVGGGPYIFVRGEMRIRYYDEKQADSSSWSGGEGSASLLWLGRFLLAAEGGRQCQSRNRARIERANGEKRDIGWWDLRWSNSVEARRFIRLTLGQSVGKKGGDSKHSHTVNGAMTEAANDGEGMGTPTCRVGPPNVEVSSTVDHHHTFENAASDEPAFEPPFVDMAFCETEDLDATSGLVFFVYERPPPSGPRIEPFEPAECFCGSQSLCGWEDSGDAIPESVNRFLRSQDYDEFVAWNSQSTPPHSHNFPISSSLSQATGGVHFEAARLSFPNGTYYAPQQHSHEVGGDTSVSDYWPPYVNVQALILSHDSLDQMQNCSVGPGMRKEDFLQRMVFLATRLPPLGYVAIGPEGSYLRIGSETSYGLHGGAATHQHSYNGTSFAVGLASVPLNNTEWNARCASDRHQHDFGALTSEVANEPIYTTLMLIQRRIPYFYAVVTSDETDVYMDYRSDPTSLAGIIGIAVGGTLAGLFVIVAVLVVILVLCCVVARMRKKLQVLDQIDDLEMILAEKEKDADHTIAHLTVERGVYEVDFKEIRVKRKIGEGGSNSIVFLADYQGQQVAFKAFQTRDICQDQRTYDDFEKEVTLLASLLHPHILRFYGATLHPPRVGILMEFCPFGDLVRFLQTHEEENDGQHFPFKERMRFAWEIATAVAFLHSRDVIHRDLKPENVLISTGIVAKLCDFGLSRSVKTHAGAAKTVRVGTSAFMAPEITTGSHYDTSADTFSFGVMLFCLATNTEEPYSDQATSAFNIELRVANDENFRPRVEPHQELMTRRWLVKLIEDSWDASPLGRPPMTHVADVLRKRLDQWEEDHGIQLSLGSDSKSEASSSGSAGKTGTGSDDLRRMLKEKDCRIAELEAMLEGKNDEESSDDTSSSD